MQIKSERLIFGKYKEADLSIYRALMMNENVAKYISGQAPTLEASKIRFEYIVDLNAQHPFYGFYAVYEKSIKQPIGLAKFVKMDDKEAEIGYAISPEFWRKGYGSEITQALILFAKRYTRFKTLIALIDPDNEASFQLLLKNDFHFSHSIKEKDNKVSHAYALIL